MSVASFALEGRVGPGGMSLWTELKDGKQRRRDVCFEKKKMRCGRTLAQERPRVARRMRRKMKLPFRSDVTAGSMWSHGLGLRSKAKCGDQYFEAGVQVDQYEVVAATDSIEMKKTRTTTQGGNTWGWDNRGCVWDKVATARAGDEDWACERVRCQTLEDK